MSISSTSDSCLPCFGLSGTDVGGMPHHRPDFQPALALYNAGSGALQAFYAARSMALLYSRLHRVYCSPSHKTYLLNSAIALPFRGLARPGSRSGRNIRMVL